MDKYLKGIQQIIKRDKSRLATLKNLWKRPQEKKLNEVEKSELILAEIDAELTKDRWIDRVNNILGQLQSTTGHKPHEQQISDKQIEEITKFIDEIDRQEIKDIKQT